MSRLTVNRSTHLTGLLKSRNPHWTLTTLYTKILGTLEKMPPKAAYRKHTEKLINERMDLVNIEKSEEQLAKKLQVGEVEEAITHAENELTLARKMLEWKPWEPLVNKAPPGQWKWPV